MLWVGEVVLFSLFVFSLLFISVRFIFPSPCRSGFFSFRDLGLAGVN